MDRTLSSATTTGQSGHGSDRNKGVLRIPQNSCITWASRSDCLGHSLGESYPDVEKQSVYSTAPLTDGIYTNQNQSLKVRAILKLK